MDLASVPLDAAERRFSELHGPFDDNAHLRAEMVKHPPDCASCRAATDRDYYRDQYYQSQELQRMMTSSASGAAATAVIAIEQAQHYRGVVDLAVAWYEARRKWLDAPIGHSGAQHREAKEAFRAMLVAVREEHNRRKNAS